MIFIILLFGTTAWAQITDASFFPSMKSINPGVAHMRRGGLASIDVGKRVIEKNHDVPLGGIVGGIKTDVNLNKSTFFAAGASRLVSTELLLDKESGERKQDINSTSRGHRTITDDASSTYYGGMLDFRFFGVSYSTASYSYLNQFRVDTPPNLVARDEDKKLRYTNLKIGSAIKIKNFRVGAYVLNQKGDGDFTYTYYDPTTGNKGSSEKSSVSASAKGYGAGIGLTTAKFRSEVGLEKMYDNSLDVADNYPGQVVKPDSASRLSLVGEAKISFISLGIRFRSIKGNFIDLEDIITSNLLYENMGTGDTRNETSFNISFGDSKGFSPSAFYTQSETTAKELSPVFDNGLKYKAVTKAKAYGVNLSYRF